MVNQNFEKFHKLQEKHKSSYLGKDTDQKQLNPDPEYNNQSNTDKAIGATGRELK
ncbi:MULTISPECIES: hypothetical protein [Heyndrickxia]|uniref:Uncharacterized protein n=1 Tax=Heyndrickxia vini TaxID=1476025 RepID=A0ABX7E6C9_9BACI|nr:MULTISPECIES: hypothetical protein [Heyndrickxia]QQZ11296.1 hypothetical protein I5776_10590 [Heyndrickxia vini]